MFGSCSFVLCMNSGNVRMQIFSTYFRKKFPIVTFFCVSNVFEDSESEALLAQARAKCKNNWQNHWEWLNKPFQNASKPWEWFKGKEIGFRMSWSREMLNGVSLLVNSCFKDILRRGFYIALWPATTIISSAENHGKSWKSWRSDRIFTVPRLCSAFGWDQLGVVYYELLKPSETITGDRYRTQLMRLILAVK